MLFFSCCVFAFFNFKIALKLGIVMSNGHSGKGFVKSANILMVIENKKVKVNMPLDRK